MKMIPLTQGKFAKVDDADYEWLSQWGWFANSISGIWYAGRKNNRNILMHREIVQAPDGIQVDHINHNGLDNRRANLRLATNAQNGRNKKKRNDNTSGFIGVSFHKERGKYQANVCVNGKQIHLGLFTDPVEAARARGAAAKRLHGEFASLNFQDEQ